MVAGVTGAQAPVILGYEPPPPTEVLPPIIEWHRVETPDTSLIKAIESVQEKANDYRMYEPDGQVENLKIDNPEVKIAFNDLQLLDPTYRPVTFNFWSPDSPHERILGIEIVYANDQRIQHGRTNEKPTHTLSLNKDGSESVFEIIVRTKSLTTTPTVDQTQPVITSVQLFTTHFRTLDTRLEGAGELVSPKPDDLTLKDEQSHYYRAPDERAWSLRGFFGIEIGKVIVGLGVVFGQDVFVPVPIPTVRIVPNLFFELNFGERSTQIRDSIERIVRLRPAIIDKFRFGAFVSGGQSREATYQAFNFLDSLDPDWKMKSISFYAKNKKLSGIHVDYTNGKEVSCGVITGTAVWTCRIKSDLITARIAPTSGCIQSLEFVCASKDGLPAPWPTDVSMVRYLGEGDITQVSAGTVQAAPKHNGVKWSVRGFYGEAANERICALGIIWGCG